MRVSFRTILVGCLITFLVATVSVVGVVSYVSSKRSAEQLSGQIIDQVALRIDTEIHALLDVAVRQSELAEHLLAGGSLDPSASQKLALYYYDVMTVETSLSYLSFARESDGAYCHTYRDQAGKLTLRQLVREPDGRLSLTDYERRGTELVETLHEPDKPGNDGRTRPYYRAAVDHGRATWTETYMFLGQAGRLDYPGVTYATPIMVGGTRVGVMSADFELRSLSQFLATLHVIKHGYAFVVEERADGTRRVIAHPDPSILTRAAAGGAREAIAAEDVSDLSVRALLARMPPAPSRLGDSSSISFAVGGTSYVGAFHALTSNGDLRWSIGIVVPENDILGEVNANTRFQAIVGIVAVAIAILLALFVAALVARPLNAIAREAAAIGQFFLEPSPKSGRVTEVHMLGVAVEDMKASLRSFKKFVPSDIVRALILTGIEAKRGGERKTLTIFFSDLEGFTSVSEQLEPETLVALLGEYLEAMTDLILASGGTIDKYIGDAIMAFWNAPAPVSDHALRACKTALANQQRLVELREDWKRRGLPQFRVRIGINTGDAIVGNIGSEDRLDYTAIGDSVNLASRLEGLNKYFNTGIMLSAGTYAEVEHDVVVRPLDLVSVKGKANGVMVYELLALRADADPSLVEFAKVHADALAAYLASDWDRAIAGFRDVLARRPDDGASATLIERCEALKADPPGPNWDGVYRMYRK